MSTPEDGIPDDSSAGPEVEAASGRSVTAPARTPRSVSRADVAAVALVVVVAVVGYVLVRGGGGGSRPPSPDLTPGAARRLMAAPARTSSGATLDLAGAPAGATAVLREGAGVPLSFRVEADSRPLVLEERSTHEIALLFPPPGRPSVVIPASRRIAVEGPEGGMYVVREPAGPRRVRLVVFPPDVDPFAIQPVELSRLLPRLTIVEREYVAAPREESGE